MSEREATAKLSAACLNLHTAITSRGEAVPVEDARREIMEAMACLVEEFGFIDIPARLRSAAARMGAL